MRPGKSHGGHKSRPRPRPGTSASGTHGLHPTPTANITATRKGMEQQRPGRMTGRRKRNGLNPGLRSGGGIRTKSCALQHWYHSCSIAGTSVTATPHTRVAVSIVLMFAKHTLSCTYIIPTFHVTLFQQQLQHAERVCRVLLVSRVVFRDMQNM